ncbi:MAG: DUF4124 domain-containing protein [Burkholderiales bacterium]|jgi:hypothetical protein|nr:DUF4124 domain-containing protein [Burkholderiales bacterium]
MKKELALITTSIGMVLLLTANSVTAQRMYRCTTNDGRIVYSDQGCASTERSQVVKIIDNSMDNSNLQNTVAAQSGLNSAMAAQGGGGNVLVIGNSRQSSSSASSSSSSAPPPSRPARRRCGG